MRVGDEVRRPPQPSGPAVHALLDELRRRHFEAPVPLGLDAQGRDRFTYVDGEVGVPPFPAWVLEDGALASTARLLRRFHEATTSLSLGSDLPWDTAFAGAGGRVVGHNDVCPENTVFRGGQAVAFIDFDLAAPTDPVLDLAHLLRMWAPLGVAEGPDRGTRLTARMRSGVRAYGLAPGHALPEAMALSVDQAERFVTSRLDRPDLTTGYFAQRRAELVEAASSL